MRWDTAAAVRGTLRYVPAVYRARWAEWADGVAALPPDRLDAYVRHAEWFRRIVRQMRESGVGLLDADPLEDIRNTRRVRAVVLNGRYLDRAALDGLLADAERAAGAPVP